MEKAEHRLLVGMEELEIVEVQFCLVEMDL
jgi:hypothetical protein